jgi:hypothetical protein
MDYHYDRSSKGPFGNLQCPVRCLLQQEVKEKT